MKEYKLKNQPIRLPGLKPGVCSGWILSGNFYSDLKTGVWRRRTYQKGVAIVIALLILLVLTLIGISAVNTSIFETNIAGNERVGANAFYASEAGVQVAFIQLPITTPILRTPTRTGGDSYYWSGTPQDRESPISLQSSLQSMGIYPKTGFALSSWEFKRYQANATGEYLGSMKQTEIQVSYGPFGAGTQYNN